MIDDIDLEEKTIQALRQYRKALARVESLEQEEASARRALKSMLPDLGRAILEDELSPNLGDGRAGQAAAVVG